MKGLSFKDMQFKSAFMLVCCSAMAIIYTFLLFRYKKYWATWSFGELEVPVLLVGIPIALISAFIMRRIFTMLVDEDYLFKNWAIGFLTLSFAGCIILGITLTEPKEHLGWSGEREKTTYNDDYQHSHTSIWLHSFGDSSSNVGGGGGLEIGEDGGEALAYLLLFLFVVIMMVLSALIPHFWIVGALTMLTILVIQMIRQMQRDKGHLF